MRGNAKQDKGRKKVEIARKNAAVIDISSVAERISIFGKKNVKRRGSLA